MERVIRTKSEIEKALKMSKSSDANLPEYNAFGDYNYYRTDILEEALTSGYVGDEDDYLDRDGWSDADVYSVLEWLTGSDDTDFMSDLLEDYDEDDDDIVDLLEDEDEEPEEDSSNDSDSDDDDD